MRQQVFDGNSTFVQGQNSGLLADRIGEGQYYKGINVTTRLGALSPRSGYRHLPFEVEQGKITLNDGNTRTFEAIVRTGNVQAAIPYNDCILLVINGLLFTWDESRGCISFLPISDTNDFCNEESSSRRLCRERPILSTTSGSSQRLNARCQKLNWSEAGESIVIFDYPDYPVIIEDKNAYRSARDNFDAEGNPCPLVPNGTIGAFNQNRLFVGSAFNEFTAGDVVGNLAAPDAPLSFKEVFIEAAQFLGQSFSLGSHSDQDITAIGFLQVADTSTGIGPLFVSTSDAIYAYRTDIPREQWESTQFGRVVLYNAGIAGARAFTNLNNDLIFMGGDGRIRSFLVNRQNQSQWSNNPIDREVQCWTKTHRKDLLKYTIVEEFQDRVFITVDPQYVTSQGLCGQSVSDVGFTGLVVLELDNVSGILRDGNPVWAGMWTGLRITELFKFKNRLFAISKDPSNQNTFYEIDEELTHDIYNYERRAITSRIYTREYNFRSQNQLKESVDFDPHFSNLEGCVEISIEQKTESQPSFCPHSNWTHNAKTCLKTVDCQVPNLSSHTLRDYHFGSGEEQGCHEITEDAYTHFKKIGYRITISAINWMLENLVVSADVEPDEKRITICEKYDKCRQEKKCDTSDRDLYITAIPKREAQEWRA